MAFFGPISSIFDFATFAVMLLIFKAGPELFRTGWFVESLATQSLVVFLIRTRRVPFFHSRAGIPLTLATIAVVLVGALLPFTPLAHFLGFTPLPPLFFAILVLMIAIYLALIEIGKRMFFGAGRRRSERRQKSRRTMNRSGRDPRVGPMSGAKSRVRCVASSTVRTMHEAGARRRRHRAFRVPEKPLTPRQR